MQPINLIRRRRGNVSIRGFVIPFCRLVGVHRYGAHLSIITAHTCASLRCTPTSPKKKMTNPKEKLLPRQGRVKKVKEVKRVKE